MPLAQTKIYTEDDYYNLPEDIRAELLDGQLIYNQAASSRIHQTILIELSGTIREYIRSQKGSCRVYPAPFSVKLFDDGKNIVEPDISIICDHNKLTDKGCTGAPDWIIEIVSPSSRTMDYYKKLITNPHFKWGFEKRPQGLCYCSPQRRLSQAYITCRR